MKTFEQLSQSWQQQEASHPEQDPTSALKTRVQYIMQKKRVTQIVLAVALTVLVAYLVWTFNADHPSFILGLMLMILCLAIRILMEWRSVRRFSQVQWGLSLEAHHQQMISYHRHRLRIHQWYTPILLSLYWMGFVMLIPTLHRYLSDFWFQYTWISSIPIAVFLVGWIAYQIRRELQMINSIAQDVLKVIQEQ
ncbi:hypothetical protein [Nonlabens xiamenensis]|uniref:hypothetical protein n=1 Tax=Nonlabens xiamenensis TaxID=2341043 RepID=UPI000F610138|nr:hypothetical protein [Nonlabens xiamenensis]